MKIELTPGLVLTVPTDPKQLTAAQYLKIRIAAAKMSGLCSNMDGMRKQIAAAIAAVDANNPEAAKTELTALYYSAHLAVSNQDPAAELFSWLVMKPAATVTATDATAREFYKGLVNAGLKWHDVEKAISFFLPKLGLN